MNALDFNPPGTSNSVCDISHLNQNVDLSKVKSSGILGILHKATQSGGSTLFHDKAYPIRRKAAKEQGLYWGAYHFGTSGNGTNQADAFLEYTQPNNDTLLVLDFERVTTHGESSMSLQEATDFVNQIKLKTGKYPGIYGGSLLKELLRRNPSQNSELLNCWLWIAQYGTVPHLPNGWDNYTLWQYTDGANGPGAQPINGIGNCDRDLFKGTDTELVTFWNKQQV